jgi:hypothetical protein
VSFLFQLVLVINIADILLIISINNYDDDLKIVEPIIHILRRAYNKITNVKSVFVNRYRTDNSMGNSKKQQKQKPNKQ